MVCEAVKNQKNEIEDLEKTLASLEARVASLEENKK